MSYFRWQYQAKAEPLVVAASVPSFDWFQQASEPIFPRRVIEGGVAAPLEPIVAVPDIVPQQQSDISRPLLRLEGFFVRGYDNTELSPDIDWLQSQPDIVRLIPQIREELVFQPEPIAPFDWFQQYPEPLPRPTRHEGYFALVEFAIPVVFDIDWLRQHPEPLPKPIRPEGILVRGLDNSEISPSFDWFQQQPEPLPKERRPEGYFALVEFIAPIPLDIDWIRQHPEPSPRPIRPEGIYVRGFDFTEISPPFDWYQQYPEPLPLPIRPEGHFALVEFSVPTPPVPNIDFIVQETPIFRARYQVSEGGAVIGQPPITEERIVATIAIVFGGKTFQFP